MGVSENAYFNGEKDDNQRDLGVHYSQTNSNDLDKEFEGKEKQILLARVNWSSVPIFSQIKQYCFLGCPGHLKPEFAIPVLNCNA